MRPKESEREKQVTSRRKIRLLLFLIEENITLESQQERLDRRECRQCAPDVFGSRGFDERSAL
jgi:hypothetical protein